MDSATSAALSSDLETSHVDLHLLARETLEVAPQSVDLAAALADDDPGARRMDVDRDLALLGGLADLYVRYAGPAQLLLDVVPDLEVLAE